MGLPQPPRQCPVVRAFDSECDDCDCGCGWLSTRAPCTGIGRSSCIGVWAYPGAGRAPPGGGTT
jgi:hypothetical protein